MSMINTIKIALIAFVRCLSNFVFDFIRNLLNLNLSLLNIWEYIYIYIDSRWVSIVWLKFNFEPVPLKFHRETNYFHAAMLFL